MRLFRCIDLLAFDRSPWCELVAFTMSAWNKEQTLKFLLFLRDVKHRDHRNRLVIQDSYQKIVDLLRPDIADVSVDAINKKFRTITNQVIALYTSMGYSSRRTTITRHILGSTEIKEVTYTLLQNARPNLFQLMKSRIKVFVF